MKKILTVVLAIVMVFAFTLTATGCGSSDEGGASASSGDLKVGIILVGDENEGYSYAHIEGIKQAAEKLGISENQLIWKYSIGEDEACLDSAKDLADQGCSLVISNSYGHQAYMQQAASEYPEVTFVSDTGDTAALSGLDNFKNAFTDVYQSRYVSGVVAGLKLKELDEAGKISDKNKDKDGKVKIGYVGAYPYAEVVSGYTAFFLGIQSVYENISMDVQYTNSWFDITAEGEAANALMARGCIIIGQHADSTGAPAAVQAAYEKGSEVYSVGYNVSMLEVAPDVALTSSSNVWEVFYEYVFSSVLNGEELMVDWHAGYDQGAVAITELGTACAEGTAEKVAEVEAGLQDGSVKVFDTSTFTVGEGAYYEIDKDGHVTSCKAIDTDGDFTPDSEEAIEDGAFVESTFRSAPYFSLRINGITELNAE